MRQKNNRRLLRLLCVLCALLLVLVGCSDKYEGLDSKGNPVLSDPDFQRTPPPLRLAASSGLAVSEEIEGVVGEIDTGNAGEGYVGASVAVSGKRAIFQIVYAGEVLYQYPLRTDGQYDYFPLSKGSGSYNFTIWIEVEGANYALYFEQDANVTVTDEFGAFLVPNKIVNYSASSAAVKLSYDLTQNCSNDLEVVQVLYRWVCDNIEYDVGKAENADALKAERYVPDVDQVLSSRTGICYDYASLVAAMLRANGIPTRLVMGNADTGEGGMVYHAWNEVYLEDAGWIAIKIEVKPGDYTRVDTTFAAGSDSSIGDFVGDGSNYYESTYH